MSAELLPSAGSAELGRLQVADELVDRARAECPGLATVSERDQILFAAWLASLRSARTRRAYATDVFGWRAWLAARDVDVLAARRVHVDLWARLQQDQHAAPSSVRRRMSALSSFYGYAASRDLVPGNPLDGIARPEVDPDYTGTVGLDRDQARALLAAADADTGPAWRRTRAAIRLQLHNGLRADELCQADVADLSHDRGHRVLTLVRKGGRRHKAALAPATWEVLEDYLAVRATTAGLTSWQDLSGPLLATNSGGRLRQSHLWDLVRRLARTADLEVWNQLSPHSLRHTAITLALDAGANIRDVQDFAGHRDPRTTRRYDHSRGSLDRSPTYTLAAYLA